VDVYLPSDRATGRPRGFAFIEYRAAAGATAAIARFDGYELRDRNLRVNEAEDKRPRPGMRPTDAPGSPPPRFGKSKGSRRNLRARKRSL
jgi:RNA recognition motif-containing protein